MPGISTRTILFILGYIYFECVMNIFPQPVNRGKECKTPNNESAICIPVRQCTVLMKAIATRNKTSIDFARKSQCGYESEALVCCGTTAYPIPVQSHHKTKMIKIKPFIHNNLPHSSVCGIESSERRIYGGQQTDLDEFPWACLLRYTNEIGQDAGFRCGGSLVNHKYVLTAAHCVTFLSGLSLSTVRFGEWRISTDIDCVGEESFKECAKPTVNVDVANTVLHPQYNKRQHLNDIALVRLKWNVRYTDFVRPICLPPPNQPPPEQGTKVIAVGWGATEKGDHSDIKLKVELSIVSKQECNKKMQKRTQISDRHLCAGGTHGKDSCQGDSGGPLTIMVENEATSQPQWFQEGIISWGIGCGIDGYPGVYTKVSDFTNWIVSSMVFDDK